MDYLYDFDKKISEISSLIDVNTLEFSRFE